jgi:hypothetical protein
MLGKLIRPLALLACALAVAAPAAAQPGGHPRLHVALGALREARAELRDSRDDFGGRRDEALAALDDAARSLRQLLHLSQDEASSAPHPPDYYERFPDHPRLRSALRDLREARDELRAATTPNLGELRAQAEDDLDYAIGQVVGLLRHRRR